MDYDKLLTTTMSLGYMLLKNGAETYRVENSIEHILKAYGIEGINVFCVPSSIIVTINTIRDHSLTKTKRLHSRTLDLDKIGKLNDLSRYICTFKPSFHYIEDKLREINNGPQFSITVQILAYALISFAFTLFFGGSLKDGICAIPLGLMVKTFSLYMERFKPNIFFSTMLSSAIIAILAIISVKLNFGTNVDKIIIGIFMNLVPGVALTNSVRDFIAGDFISGQTKLIEVLLTGTAIALGPGIALYISRFL